MEKEARKLPDSSMYDDFEWGPDGTAEAYVRCLCLFVFLFLVTSALRVLTPMCCYSVATPHNHTYELVASCSSATRKTWGGEDGMEEGDDPLMGEATDLAGARSLLSSSRKRVRGGGRSKGKSGRGRAGRR